MEDKILKKTDLQSDTTTMSTGAQQSVMGLSKNEAINQFIEWPFVREDGAHQPLQYRASGHLLANGVFPDNIKAANLISIAMLSGRLGYPIPLMLETDAPQRAIQLLDQSRLLIPSEAIIEFQEFRPEYLYYDAGKKLNGKCIVSPTVNGFKKACSDLELILTRGHSTRQELAKGKYDFSFSEHQSKMQVSLIGVNDGKSKGNLSLPSIPRIPIKGNHTGGLLTTSEVIKRYNLIYSPLFKMRKTYQRLKWRPVYIPFEQQIESAMVEGGCDNVSEKMGIIKNLISIFAIMREPPPLHMAELGAIIYGTDEKEVSHWLQDTGHKKDVESKRNEPLTATKYDYYLALQLLEEILISGPNHFTDRQREVFETVKAINKGKTSTMILKRGDDVEILAAIIKNYGCWASREKIFEFINKGDDDFSLSSVSNDLVDLVKMGVLERRKPPKNRFFGYYITTPTLSNAIQLPTPETIIDPVYQGKKIDIVNPYTDKIDRI